MPEDNEGCVGGDGGPLIVLQASSIPLWRGSDDFDNSLMNGGTVETDYDVVCGCSEEVDLVHRYERDILVLWDAEWGAQMFALPTDDIALTQGCYPLDELSDLLNQAAENQPRRSFPIHVQDSTLRLLVGADDGDGKTWGCYDLPVEPGLRQCDVYLLHGDFLVILRPQETEIP